MNDKEVNLKNKNSNVLVIVIVLLGIAVLGMGFYIAYDKEVIFSKADKDTNEVNDNDSKNNENEEDNGIINDNNNVNDNTSNQIKDLDLTRCLNNADNVLSFVNSIVAPSSNHGLSMRINPDKKSITLSIDWQIFGPLSNATAWADQVKDYQIIGFSKSINRAFVGDLGQDSMGITLFYLMEDGTVEYTPMFIKKTDSQNNLYYAMNYASFDGFTTSGMIAGVDGIINIYIADAYIKDGGGYYTTLCATKDGSFYNLGTIIK